MLSELQKLIIGGLNLCKLQKDDITAIILLLQTETQHMEMAEYIDKIVDDPPDKATVFEKATQIAAKNTIPA